MTKNAARLLKGMVAAVVLLGGSGFAAPATHAATKSVVEDIVGPNGDRATVTNNYSVKSDVFAGTKTSLTVSFINDPKSNKKIAVINTNGSNINANYNIVPSSVGGAPGYMQAFADWASEYSVSMELGGGSAQFHVAAPINTIDEKTISSTVGYSIGGSVTASATPSGELNASANWSTTTSYNQADYQTNLESGTNDKFLKWHINFKSAMNQGWGPFDRDSNGSWGNELWMKSRNNSSIWAKDNFITADQMPALASKNASPGMVAAVIADKNEKTTELKVNMGRYQDRYVIDWYGTFTGLHGGGAGDWVGTNRKNYFYNDSVQKYTLDWENETLIEN